MSTNTRGVVDPNAIPTAIVTPDMPVPEWPRGPLTPRIAPAWWWGNPPGARMATGNTPAAPVTPEIPSTPAGDDCGCR